MKKVIRYIRLYGWRRTYLAFTQQIGKMRISHRPGFKWCGSHAYSVIAYSPRKEFANIYSANTQKETAGVVFENALR